MYNTYNTYETFHGERVVVQAARAKFETNS